MLYGKQDVFFPLPSPEEHPEALSRAGMDHVLLEIGFRQISVNCDPVALVGVQRWVCKILLGTVRRVQTKCCGRPPPDM